MLYRFSNWHNMLHSWVGGLLQTLTQKRLSSNILTCVLELDLAFIPRLSSKSGEPERLVILRFPC